MTPVDDSEPTPEALLQAGLERYQAGDRVAAEALFRRAIAARPGEPTALYLLSLARFESGDAAEARALLEEVVRLRPDHAQARLTLANLRLWGGENAVAVEDYRLVLALEPGHAGAWIGLAQALQAGGDVAGALAAARSAAAAAPGEAAAQLGLAVALTNAGQSAEAADAYRAAIRLAPETGAAHVGLALALLQIEDPVGALASAVRASELDPGSAEPWLALGAALRALGQPGRAADALRRSLEIDPNRATAHLSLGNAYVKLNKAPEAERHMLRAVELDPASKEALANLSSFYYLAGEYEPARDYALRALEIDPGMTVAHQNLAGVHAREGREDEARHHRDAAYGERNLFVETAADPLRRVLILTTTESGNVPERYLLPADHFTRLMWFIEYARDEQMQHLPDYDVVFNGIGDADLAGPTARNVARFLEVCDKRVLNPPDKIQRTFRHMAPGLYGDVPGVLTPAVARLEAVDIAAHGLLAAAKRSGVDLPMLVRPIGSHGGVGLTLVDARSGPDEVAAAHAPGRDHYVTAFHDFRSADGLCRKYRMIFVDRVPYPYHLAIGPDWMVHYETSGTDEHPERLAEELRFLKDPQGALGAGAYAAIGAIGRRIDLDFCGVDFTVLPDGRVLVFEANATMLVHPETPDGPLAHKNAYVERILRAFQAML